MKRSHREAASKSREIESQKVREREHNGKRRLVWGGAVAGGRAAHSCCYAIYTLMHVYMCCRTSVGRRLDFARNAHAAAA